MASTSSDLSPLADPVLDAGLLPQRADLGRSTAGQARSFPRPSVPLRATMTSTRLIMRRAPAAIRPHAAGTHARARASYDPMRIRSISHRAALYGRWPTASSSGSTGCISAGTFYDEAVAWNSHTVVDTAIDHPCRLPGIDMGCLPSCATTPYYCSGATRYSMNPVAESPAATSSRCAASFSAASSVARARACKLMASVELV